jgi:uncharacterized protein (DUF697 family)
MAKLSALPNTWQTIREVDLRPLRDQALKMLKIAIVGAPGSGRSTLADQMRRDPARPHLVADTPVLILDIENSDQALGADLIILIMDSRKRDSTLEQELVKGWHNRGARVLVFINQFEASLEIQGVAPAVPQPKQRVVWGSALDSNFLLEQFAPIVIDSLRDRLLSLGRHFPLFRVPLARYMINDTCISNAAYALSTGLAETIAVLDIPIAVADMVILTKNQAYMAYKLGLALGYSTRWQDYVVEFGGVLGGGFLWREIARTLVGLIPVWGIVPKAAISYAGTYVVGHAILQWYLTGRHISKKQMRELYQQAFARGKELARALLGRIPRPRLPRIARPRLPKLPRPRLRRRTKALPPPESGRLCPNCGESSAEKAHYCQYCGEPFFQEGDVVESRGAGPSDSPTDEGMSD